MSDLPTIFLLSLLAMFNPSLIGAVTVMLLLPSPKRLMFGYLLGAYMTAIGVGLVIVFSLHGSTFESTSRHSIGPLEDIVLGVLAVTIAWVLRTGRDRPFQERRRAKKDAKLRAKQEAGKPTESLPLRMLGKGDPKVTFVVGALLSFPGVSYIAALGYIHNLKAGVAPTALLVVCFCLIELLFLELPLVGYVFAPESTQDRVTRFRNWMGRSGRSAAVIGASVIGAWLLIRGVITLL
ncbi:MAG TPA: GAP family protein [Solirubrobacteraceae bacterium]|nr:GAP family protein [Solirubrobacteraceae bacterium]